MPVRVNTLRTVAPPRAACSGGSPPPAMSPAGSISRSIARLRGAHRFGRRGCGGIAARPRSPAFTAAAWQSTSAPRKASRSASATARARHALRACAAASPGSIVTRRLRSSAAVLGSTLQSRSSIVCSERLPGGRALALGRCTAASARTQARASISRTDAGTHARASQAARDLVLRPPAARSPGARAPRSSAPSAATRSASARACSSRNASTLATSFSNRVRSVSNSSSTRVDHALDQRSVASPRASRVVEADRDLGQQVDEAARRVRLGREEGLVEQRHLEQSGSAGARAAPSRSRGCARRRTCSRRASPRCRSSSRRRCRAMRLADAACSSRSTLTRPPAAPCAGADVAVHARELGEERRAGGAPPPAACAWPPSSRHGRGSRARALPPATPPLPRGCARPSNWASVPKRSGAAASGRLRRPRRARALAGRAARAGPRDARPEGCWRCDEVRVQVVVDAPAARAAAWRSSWCSRAMRTLKLDSIWSHASFSAAQMVAGLTGLASSSSSGRSSRKPMRWLSAKSSPSQPPAQLARHLAHGEAFLELLVADERELARLRAGASVRLATHLAVEELDEMLAEGGLDHGALGARRGARIEEDVLRVAVERTSRRARRARPRRGRACPRAQRAMRSSASSRQPARTLADSCDERRDRAAGMAAQGDDVAVLTHPWLPPFWQSRCRRALTAPVRPVTLRPHLSMGLPCQKRALTLRARSWRADPLRAGVNAARRPPRRRTSRRCTSVGRRGRRSASRYNSAP